MTPTKGQGFSEVKLVNNDDDLYDDIEDKNATYSEYSVAKA